MIVSWINIGTILDNTGVFHNDAEGENIADDNDLVFKEVHEISAPVESPLEKYLKILRQPFVIMIIASLVFMVGIVIVGTRIVRENRAEAARQQQLKEQEEARISDEKAKECRDRMYSLNYDSTKQQTYDEIYGHSCDIYE